MSGCVIVAGKSLMLATSLFSLSWTHSVERVAWVENWRVEGDRLVLVEARVKGSGAGMEPPPEARQEAGWWVWQPRLTLERLVLAASGATRAGWTFCADARCSSLGEVQGPPIVIEPCR